MKRYKHIMLILACGIMMVLLIQDRLFAQGSSIFIASNLSENLKLSFIKNETEIEKGQIISNVLLVRNSAADSLQFYVSLNYPRQWRALFNPDKLYVIPPGDSLFIPVRIIPGTLMKGDTKYFINAYIEDKNRRQVASIYFFASTPRVSSWDMIVNPSNRIYLKNNENIADFNIRLLNTGNEKQDILMTVATASSNVILMDSTEKPIDDFKYDIRIKPFEDSTFTYKVKYMEGERNFKNIDIENYHPTSQTKEKKFSVFFHSEEPRREKYSNQSQNSKLDFIKLSNDKKVNPYGSDVLPLSAYLRVSNLMDDIIFSSLHLRGQKFFKNGGNLIYNTSLYFSSIQGYYGNNYTRNIPWYIGYFDKKKSIQVGYVNGGAIGIQSSGKGIKGEIEFLPGHWGGGYYVKSPYLFSSDRLESYGFHYRMQFKNFSNQAQYSHSHHKYANLVTDVISLSPKIRLAGKHSINFTGAFSNRYSYFDIANTYTRNGYMLGAGYTSTFFSNVWKLNAHGTYTSPGFGAWGYKRIFLNHRSRLKIAGDLEMSVINNYNQYNYDSTFYNYIPGYDKNYFFFNSVNFHSKKYLRDFRPGLFYDIRNHWGYDFHTRGLNLSFNTFDVTRNIQASMIHTIGFSRIMNSPLKRENFTYKLSTLIRYQNFSFTGFYNYGPLTPSMIEIKETSGITPQTIRASFIYMYLFRNRHLALQSRVSYMYSNIHNHHSLNLSPELFYFTNSGWRFSLNPTFTYYSSKFRSGNFELPSYINQQDYDTRRYSNDNFNISLGVRKDFGIPIPGTFSDFSNISFVAFYDLDGNGVQDTHEPGIENIVIKVGDWNVITNSMGNASFENADPGSFEFDVFSLTDLRGWFPQISDTLAIFKEETIHVPFVKGVKLSGSVFIEYEIANTPDDKKINLSGIKISALNGKAFHTLTGTNGEFEFFLPFGEYTISLDESILNGRYFILKNNYTLDLTQQIENMYITFHIVEKKRKVRLKKFNVDGEINEEP